VRTNEHDRRSWKRKKKATKTLKNSGLFNAGLTPCSHTTTTKELFEYSPPGEYLKQSKNLIIYNEQINHQNIIKFR